MRFFSLLTTSRAARQVEALSQAVAKRARPAVFQCVVDRAAGMGRAEARGYIRARAAKAVRSTADVMLSGEGPLPAWGRSTLLAKATDQVVQQVAFDLFRPQPATVLERRAG